VVDNVPEEVLLRIPVADNLPVRPEVGEEDNHSNLLEAGADIQADLEDGLLLVLDQENVVNVRRCEEEVDDADNDAEDALRCDAV